MDEDKVRKLADGRIYSANQAVENGLIDAVDSLEAEKEALIEENGLDEEIEFYAPENTVNDFWYSLFSKAGELFPKTEIDLASDIVENQGNGVLKYYAK